MRQVVQSRFGSPTPPARWHERYEEPRRDDTIEVHLGDPSVWTGVRFARDLECFIDAESGVPISVVMWRYARRREEY